jgi:putative hemolysin/predicted secreted protein
VNCGQVGGTIEIRTDASGGQYGMCTFANGTSCEEWALFNDKVCRPGVTAATTTAAGAGMANPASVACVNSGGKLEIKKDATGGEYGMCTFANGTSCEEWALFNDKVCKPGVVAAATTAAPAGMANPASVACVNAGGKLEIKKDATGGEYGMCTFANGTSCEEWALLNDKVCKPGVAAAATTAPEGKKMVTLTEANDGKTEDIAQGTRFAVQLEENPTTGFQWNATVSPGLEIQSSEYQMNKAAEGMVGVGGTRTWVIVAKDLGTQKFSATYKRSWEATTGNETGFSANVNVVKI